LHRTTIVEKSDRIIDMEVGVETFVSRGLKEDVWVEIV